MDKMADFIFKSYAMVDFKFTTRWLRMEGRNLKGKDLIVALMFLTFFIVVGAMLLATIEWPKVQVLF